MQYKVTKKIDVERVGQSVGSKAKETVMLSGDMAGPYGMGVVVCDHTKGKAEVHEKSADTWHVLKGNARFILGGRLKDPTSSKPGEWRAEIIEGAETVEVSEGDVIDIPPGVPHQIDASEARIELLITKINL